MRTKLPIGANKKTLFILSVKNSLKNRIVSLRGQKDHPAVIYAHAKTILYLTGLEVVNNYQ